MAGHKNRPQHPGAGFCVCSGVTRLGKDCRLDLFMLEEFGEEMHVEFVSILRMADVITADAVDREEVRLTTGKIRAAIPVFYSVDLAMDGNAFLPHSQLMFA